MVLYVNFHVTVEKMAEIVESAGKVLSFEQKKTSYGRNDLVVWLMTRLKSAKHCPECWCFGGHEDVIRPKWLKGNFKSDYEKFPS